jgi:hypothetical protein
MHYTASAAWAPTQVAAFYYLTALRRQYRESRQIALAAAFSSITKKATGHFKLAENDVTDRHLAANDDTE